MAKAKKSVSPTHNSVISTKAGLQSSSKTLWSGRFTKKLQDSAIALSYTLQIDQRLVQYDIAVNRAHAKALEKVGILTKIEQKKLDTSLVKLAKAFEIDKASLLGNDEDIHSCVERHVTSELGDLGKKLHTGKSRNDQVITDVRLFVKEQALTIQQCLKDLISVMVQKADHYQNVVFPGFTHFQPAQPVLLGHHFLAYCEMLMRDITRFESVYASADVCALGSGALAGNSYGIDREFVAKELGFSKVSQNSMDSVADRDFIVEFCSSASLCMVHLSRLSEELVLWSSPIMGFIEIGDDFTTGSSIMPQKKNPDMAELIRGKTGRVFGDLMGLLTLLKALPLTYNRDMQEDKEALFDAVDTLQISLVCMTGMIPTIQLNHEAIETALSKGYLLATELADYLAKKGVPFRESHEITGKLVRYAIGKKVALESLSLKEFQSECKKIDKDIYDSLSFQSALKVKCSTGGTASIQVKKQMSRLQNEVKKWNKR